MPISNYTTEIAPEKTAGEITKALARARARRIQHEFDLGGELVALSFSLMLADQEIYYRLPSNPEGVLATLKRDGAAKRYQTLEHARRVDWRILKDWIGAQLARVDAGVAAPEEVFLPYVLIAPGKTLFESIQDAGGSGALVGGQLSLPEKSGTGSLGKNAGKEQP